MQQIVYLRPEQGTERQGSCVAALIILCLTSFPRLFKVELWLAVLVLRRLLLAFIGLKMGRNSRVRWWDQLDPGLVSRGN